MRKRPENIRTFSFLLCLQLLAAVSLFGAARSGAAGALPHALSGSHAACPAVALIGSGQRPVAKNAAFQGPDTPWYDQDIVISCDIFDEELQSHLLIFHKSASRMSFVLSGRHAFGSIRIKPWRLPSKIYLLKKSFRC